MSDDFTKKKHICSKIKDSCWQVRKTWVEEPQLRNEIVVPSIHRVFLLVQPKKDIKNMIRSYKNTGRLSRVYYCSFSKSISLTNKIISHIP